jgi:bifunctional non-homologous end joining protein LigD
VGQRVPFRVRPMLATLVPQPFDKPGWIFEEKYDGYRILAYKEGARVTLISRNGKDRTATYPAVAETVAALAAETLLLDGEVVAFDRKRVSRFQLLQEGKGTPSYAVFDCLYVNGRDLRKEPLSVRREAMGKAVGLRKIIFPSHKLASNGLRAYEAAEEKGYEGLVAKDFSSPYVEGRSSYWLKVKVHQEEEFVIAGYTAPTGTRVHFGALLLGGYHDGELYYVGKVGTGFSRPVLSSLFRRFQPMLRKTSSLIDPPRERDVTYLAPRLVAQTSFQEWTADRKLRQPVFLGLRDDKSAKECLLPESLF